MSVSPTVSKRQSGIPVLAGKRSSLGANSKSSPSAGSPTTSTSGPATSPVMLKSPPPGRNASSGARSRTTSGRGPASPPALPEVQEDDPGRLKAHIALLQTSLAASHQRIIAMTADLNFDNSAVSSPNGRSSPQQPWTPTTGFGDVNLQEVLTPMTDVSRGDFGLTPAPWVTSTPGDVPGLSPSSGSFKPGRSMIPRLPHSNPSYDLSASVATPGKHPVARKASDGPLGLTRIPQSSVAQAIALQPTSPVHSPYNGSHTSPLPSPAANGLLSPYVGPDSPYLPSAHSDGRHSPFQRRVSGGSAASTRVIDNLQSELLNVKGHNEKLRQELRSNSRLTSTLTRQNEDLKETKERMRGEQETLNNLIARKERQLQEVLERARAAESSLAEHVSHKKALEQSTKKSLAEMSTQLADAKATQLKAEREANSLRDLVKSSKSMWARDLKATKDELKAVQEQHQKQRDEATKTYTSLLQLVKAQESERAGIQTLAKESLENLEKANAMFDSRVAGLKTELENAEGQASEAKATAAELAAELGHLRRLMREPRRASLEQPLEDFQP